METNADKKSYCPVCGAVEDAEGICTNGSCPKHKLQMKLKALKEKQEATKAK